MSTNNLVEDRGIEAASREVAELKEIIQELHGIRSDMLELEAGTLAEFHNLNASHDGSARNLLHYMALRRHDLRRIQEKLAAHGLSSLGRAESHVKSNVEAIANILYRLADNHQPRQLPFHPDDAIRLQEGMALLEAHTDALLGPRPTHRTVRIMVTMPGEAANNYKLVRELLAHGMDCMRINCAYDDADSWARMIRNLRRAMKATGKGCRILMDLPGPKLRTGSLEPGPRVTRWRPRRDAFGNISKPARIWLTPAEKPVVPRATADAVLPVSGDWLAALNRRDLIKFFDTRGASRSLRVTEVAGTSRWAESQQTAYVASGTTLHLHRIGAAAAQKSEGEVGELPAREQWITLHRGDTLILTRDPAPGRPALYDERRRTLSPARISVTLPEIFEDVRAGERILFDDGKIGGRMKEVGPEEIVVEITHARPQGERLRADKGINLPDSHLHLPALTQKDVEDLSFIVKHADIVGYSFVRDAADVHQMQACLKELGGEHLGLILKIETNRAFEHLPELLLAAMRSPCAGVMIARGDLAVECGYERLAEVQEEILWICEAAHMPVIWATQVLENLAKEGLPSRAEITDAAMGERAECVMLNKGPYIVEAVRALDNILQRMQAHQSKKRSMLRPLRLANHFSVHARKPVAALSDR